MPLKEITTRFINLTGQMEDPKHIAFSLYDLDLNMYLDFNQAQAWDTWEDFIVDFKHHMGGINKTDMNRLKKLERRLPEWAKKECECEPCQKK